MGRLPSSFHSHRDAPSVPDLALRSTLDPFVQNLRGERLAFKTSLQLLYDKQPSLESIGLLDAGGVPTGTDVLTPGDKVDNILTVALVITM